MKTIIKNTLICLLGVLMLGGGVGMFSRVSIGTDSLTCFYEGISLKTGLTVGTVSLLANLAYVVIVFFLDKKKIGIATFLYMIVGKYPIDFMNEHFFTPDNIFVAILLDIVICVIIGVGCSLIVASKLGVTAYDALTTSTSEVLHKKYVIVRYIYDASFLILGVLLGGKIGIGTIIALIVIGPVFDFANKKLVK